MSIVYIPPNLQDSESLVCSICRVKLSLTMAATGLIDAGRHQTFTCISHLFEVEKLIVGWADFIAQERIKLLRQERDSNFLYGESTRDAWLNS